MPGSLVITKISTQNHKITVHTHRGQLQFKREKQKKQASKAEDGENRDIGARTQDKDTAESDPTGPQLHEDLTGLTDHPPTLAYLEGKKGERGREREAGRGGGKEKLNKC